MVCSAIMHLFWVQNKKTCERLHKLDLIGILFLILGSSICIIYYQFMCMTWYRDVYIILNSFIALCVLYTMVCGGEFVREPRLSGDDPLDKKHKLDSCGSIHHSGGIQSCSYHPLGHLEQQQ